jgi:hypothetical protein
MNTWSQDTLRKIAEADDLHIAPFREDGETYGTPTWIWWRSMMQFTYAATTANDLDGTRRRSARNWDGLSLLA